MVVWFFLNVLSVLGKEQIGHVPIKGNLWRAKFANEITGNVSKEFEQFIANARTTSSEETSITYYYSQHAYRYADFDNTMCAYSLDRNLPIDELTGQAVSFANFTLYFICDDTCCAMECCQRDIQMTIIGTGLIGISLLILLFYAFIYIFGLICAWKNGAIGRQHNGDTSLMIIKNNHILIGSSLAASVGTAVYVSKLDSIEDLTEIGIIRFGRAASTVANIVIDYKTSVKGIAEPSEEYNVAMKGCHRRSAERLLTLARNNGGVFIKVGQHIAALEYLVPPEYTEILSVLMSNAPQQSLKDIRFVLERELDQPMEGLFTNFSDKPVGAASLAQVHVANLKETGEKVAVKVQHRRVYENSKTDMKTMEFLVNVADLLFPEFKLMWLVEEVKKNLPNELDFLHEARNADRAREHFSHLSFLKIPHIHYEHSTNRVLTMEFCEGAQINDREYIAENNIDKSDLCRKLGKLISEMIFMKGYLHSDTHPGNVLVNKTPTGETQVVLLDHGLYLDVNDHIRSLYSDLWLSLLNADQQGIKRVAKDMGVGELYGLFACMVAKRSWKSVTEGIGNSPLNHSEQQELQQYAFSLLPQISEVLSRMPREMLLILKTNDLLRNMEYILECQTRQDSMIEVTKCVVRSHHELALQKTDKRLKRLRLQLSMCWSLFRIKIYELYLRFSDNFGCRI